MLLGVRGDVAVEFLRREGERTLLGLFVDSLVLQEVEAAEGGGDFQHAGHDAA